MLCSLKLRHDIMEEAKEEILSNKSNIDADTLKIVYNQAKKFVPTLQHTVEEFLQHQISMRGITGEYQATEIHKH